MSAQIVPPLKCARAHTSAPRRHEPEQSSSSVLTHSALFARPTRSHCNANRLHCSAGPSCKIPSVTRARHEACPKLTCRRHLETGGSLLSAAAVHNAHVQTDTENVTAYDASNPSFLNVEFGVVGESGSYSWAPLHTTCHCFSSRHRSAWRRRRTAARAGNFEEFGGDMSADDITTSLFTALQNQR